ncbi:RNA polymerase sigma factor [Nonomuraea endophytica]|uniref:RNA polymerase sigma factor n=1 Tax=Nonomuraea endophytica TaxID=714136 RepID=UPI0037CC989A
MEIHRSPLDAAEHIFQLVADEPYGLSLDGAALAPDLPQRPLPLSELRTLLTRRTISDPTRDVVWRELVRRARLLGAMWLVGAVGVALPALRGIAGRITSGYLAGDPEDIDNEVLARFIEAVRTIDIDAANVRPRLCNEARRAGERARKLAESTAGRPLPVTVSVPPKPPWGHPDFVLFDAVAKGVVSELDAELIGRTRLEERTLADAAAELGLSEEAAKKRRQRAEPVLCAAVEAGEVSAGLSLTITSICTREVEDQISAWSRDSSDTPSELDIPKGGRGTTPGSTRSTNRRRPQDAPALQPNGKNTGSPPPEGKDPCRWSRRFCRVAAVVLIAAAVVATIATAVLAETPRVLAVPSDLGKVFDNLRNWLIGLLATLATLMLTIGGLRYLVAGGDPGEVQKAKGALKAAAFGYALAILAPLFVSVLKRVVGG